MPSLPMLDWSARRDDPDVPPNLLARADEVIE
jgi:hypothetical protein